MLNSRTRRATVSAIPWRHWLLTTGHWLLSLPGPAQAEPVRPAGFVDLDRCGVEEVVTVEVVGVGPVESIVDSGQNPETSTEIDLTREVEDRPSRSFAHILT